MDIYGFPLGCNCCQSSYKSDYRATKQIKNEKNLEVLNLKFEIEEMKRNGLPQEEINKKLNELKIKIDELNNMTRELQQVGLQELRSRIDVLENFKNNDFEKIQEKLVKIERIQNQSHLKRTRLLQVDQLRKEIERLKKAGVSQEEINKKLKELEVANKDLEDIITDIGDNELQEYLERIERLERELDNFKKDAHTIGVLTRNKKVEDRIQDLETKTKKMGEKLNVFNITEGYVSVNKRIVQAKDAVDGYDLVTMDQLGQVNKNLKQLDNNLMNVVKQVKDVLIRLHPGLEFEKN